MKSFFKKWIHAFENSEIIVLPNQLNLIISGLLFFGVATFAAGYFWGQQKAVDYFIKRIEEDSFADRISYALYTMNDRDSVEFEEAENSDSIDNESSENSQIDSVDSIDSEEDSGLDNSEKLQDSASGNEVDDIPTLSLDELKSYKYASDSSDIDESLQKKSKENCIDHIKETDDTVYLARLAGFGTLQAARVFLHRVQAIDKHASLVEHLSTTQKGRKMKWFQVVTSDFKDKKDLEFIVKRIKNKEFISDVQIIEKKKG